MRYAKLLHTKSTDDTLNYHRETAHAIVKLLYSNCTCDSQIIYHTVTARALQMISFVSHVITLMVGYWLYLILHLMEFLVFNPNTYTWHIYKCKKRGENLSQHIKYRNKICKTLHDDVIKWNFFRVTGHLSGEFTGHRWIPRTKASDAELWCLLWSAPE